MSIENTLPDWVQTLTPWLISIFGIGAGIIVARTHKTGGRENVLLDQVQEERSYALTQLRVEREEMKAERIEMKAERAEMRARLAEIMERQDRAAQEEAIILGYVRDLRQYIVEGRPPPPPPVPDLFAARYYRVKLGTDSPHTARLVHTKELSQIVDPQE